MMFFCANYTSLHWAVKTKGNGSRSTETSLCQLLNGITDNTSNPPTPLQPTGLMPVSFQLCKNKTHAIKDIRDLDLSSAAW